MTHSLCRFAVAALTTFCIFLPFASQAQESTTWIHELRLGVLDHDTDNLWSGFSREEGIDLNAELIFSPNLQYWGGILRPNLGFSINDRGDTSKIYAGGIWQYLWQNGVSLDFAAGLALQDGTLEDPYATDEKELGSRVLLRFSLELGYTLSAHTRISLMFDHISNAYTVDPNEGLDTIGIRFGYLF